MNPDFFGLRFTSAWPKILWCSFSIFVSLKNKSLQDFNKEKTPWFNFCIFTIFYLFVVVYNILIPPSESGSCKVDIKSLHTKAPMSQNLIPQVFDRT